MYKENQINDRLDISDEPYRMFNGFYLLGYLG